MRHDRALADRATRTASTQLRARLGRGIASIERACRARLRVRIMFLRIEPRLRMQFAAPHEVNVISGKAIGTRPLNLPKSAHLARPPVRVLRRPAGSTRASLGATLLFGALHPRASRLSDPSCAPPSRYSSQCSYVLAALQVLADTKAPILGSHISGRPRTERVVQNESVK